MHEVVLTAANQIIPLQMVSDDVLNSILHYFSAGIHLRALLA
jgi:hypothetical protein